MFINEAIFISWFLQVPEALPPALSAGNLSVLKKRWEQQQPQTTPCSSTAPRCHTSSSPLIKPPSSSSVTQSQSGRLRRSQTCSETRSSSSLPPDPEDQMDGRDPERQEECATAAGVSDVENPSIPINSLKMMFERGEGHDKAGPTLHTHSPVLISKGLTLGLSLPANQDP